MREERFEVSVTFDERRGYVAKAPELRQPVTALSLGGLRDDCSPCRTVWQLRTNVWPGLTSPARGEKRLRG
jgi:hypothetical protein